MESRDFKIVLFGNSGVGKTCIVAQATSHSFSEDTLATLGACYSSTTITIHNINVHLQLWDTAGQERYRSIAPMYYRNATAAVICYAIDEKNSFNDIDSWVAGLESEGVPNIIRFLVGNKSDLSNREVTREEGEEKAAALSAYLYEVSAKTGDGIDDLFHDIARISLEKSASVENTKEKETEKVDLKKEGTKKKGCCQKGNK